MKKYFFLGGASDPEMRMIRIIVLEAGMSFVYATTDGKPCHPGNTYRADPITVLGKYRLAAIECEPVNFEEFADTVRIDHHRPQDPGFNMGPRQYWKASSVGQLHCLLGLEPTQEAKVMAALDHCFSAATNNECPGVSRDEVLSLKIREIAAATQTTKKGVCERIAFFREVIAVLPKETIGNQQVKDLRGYCFSEGYSLDLLAAQVAEAIEGTVSLVRFRDRVGEPEKIVLSGKASPETVEAFLREWAPRQGLVRIYGVPARGYAGGYIA